MSQGHNGLTRGGLRILYNIQRFCDLLIRLSKISRNSNTNTIKSFWTIQNDLLVFVLGFFFHYRYSDVHVPPNLPSLELWPIVWHHRNQSNLIPKCCIINNNVFGSFMRSIGLVWNHTLYIERENGFIPSCIQQQSIKHWSLLMHIDGLMQRRCQSSVLAMDLHLFCIKPLI